MALRRVGKAYFAEAFALNEPHGNICEKSVLHSESEIKPERSLQISLQLLLKWLFIFFTTHCKIISTEITTGVLSQKLTLLFLLGMFHITPRKTSYKKHVYGRYFPL